MDFAGATGSSDGAWLKADLEAYGVDTRLLLQDEQVRLAESLCTRRLASGTDLSKQRLRQAAQSSSRVRIRSVESRQFLLTRRIGRLSSTTADNSIVLFPGSNFAANRNRKFDLSQYTHLLVQNEIPWTETLSVLSNAHAAGVITFLNPSPMPNPAQLSELNWADVDWLLINEGEGHDLLAASDQEASPEQLLSKLQVTLGGSISILMTLGARGALALLPDGTLITAPAGKVVGEVQDTTGAGDCFTVRDLT